MLRVLDGASGEELWSLAAAKSGNLGFAGLSVALGDVDGDQRIDIVAATGDGYIAIIDADGNVIAVSDSPSTRPATAPSAGAAASPSATWTATAAPEIAYGATLFSTKGGVITRLWVGAGANGGGAGRRAVLLRRCGRRRRTRADRRADRLQDRRHHAVEQDRLPRRLQRRGRLRRRRQARGRAGGQWSGPDPRGGDRRASSSAP